MLLGIGDVANGVPSGRDLQRTAASSALRRLVLAAAACDGAAGAAATAADEIAQLRADVQRAARDEHRAQGSPCPTHPAINDAEAAGRAAQARADAALKAHRRAQLALRNSPAVAAVEMDAAGREADRREAAMATAEVAEMKAELAGLRGELAASQDKAANEALSLSHKLRSAELETQREVTAMKLLEGELDTERVHRATETQSARSAVRESMEAADTAWVSRDACMDEVKALRASLQAEADRVAWGEQEAASERHVAVTQVHTMEAQMAALAFQHHASATCVAHRETAASHLVSSLLAAQLENLLLGTFHAWRDVRLAVAKEAEWRAEVEAARQNSIGLMQNACLRDSASQAIIARREEAGRRTLATVLAAQLETLLLGAFAAWHAIAHQQHELSELADEKNEVACLRRSLEIKASELAAATHQAESDVENGLKMKCEESLLLRHAEAARSVLASVLSSQCELTIQGTFYAWLHVSRCAQDELASNKIRSEQEALLRTLTVDIKAERDARTNVEEILLKSEERAERLRHEVDVANVQVLTLQQASKEAAVSFEAKVIGEGQRQSALSVSFARLLAEQLEYIVWCAFVRWQASVKSSLQQPAQPGTAVQAAEGEIEQLKEELQRALTEARSAQLQLLDARKERSSHIMEIGELRRQLEADAVFNAAKSLEEHAQEAAVAREAHAAHLREQSYVALITRREQSCHRVLAQTMAAHLEYVVRGAFFSWRLGCTGLSASEDSRMALLGSAQHDAGSAGTLPQSQDDMASLAFFYMQKEARVRAMCVTLLASKVEQTIRGAFCVWCDFLTAVRREAEVHSSTDRIAFQPIARAEAGQPETIASYSFRQQLEERGTGGLENTLVKPEEFVAICFAQREANTRRVLAMLLARQLEVCLLGAFAAWRAGVRSDLSSNLPDGISTNMAGSSAGPEGFATEGASTGRCQQSYDCIAGSLSLLRSQLAARRLCASLLAGQMEMLISGTFHSWKDIVVASGNIRGERIYEVPWSPNCAAALQGTHQRGMQVCPGGSDNGSE